MSTGSGHRTFGGVVMLCGLTALMAAAVMHFRGGPTAEGTSISSRTPLSGTDTVVVLLVAADCPVCADPAAMSQLRFYLQAIVSGRESGSRLTLLGVALDADPRQGLSYLNRLVAFDEVAAGNGWLNLHARNLIWSEPAGIAAVPQILMLERELVVSDTGIHEPSSALTTVAIGMDAVLSWLKDFATHGDAP